MKPFDLTREFTRGLADLDALHAWLDRLGSAEPFLDPLTLSRVRLALAEAFSNAALHAHRNEAGRAVRIRVSSTDGRLIRLDVTDQGPGFDLPPLLDSPPNDHAERGRGLRILHQLAERIAYTSNTLSIWLRVSPSP